MSLGEKLLEEAASAGIALDPAIAQGCAQHYALLVRWNRTHNLTRVTEEEEAAHRHYLDCLWPALAVPAAERRDAVDIGSGAGFPGLMIALAWPDRFLTLVEPAQKRASFLRLAIAELGLGARVRVAPPPAAASALVLSRATFSRGQRAPLAAAIAREGLLWLWSVAAEEATWPDEARALGLEALEPLARTIRGERRLVLRAMRQN